MLRHVDHVIVGSQASRAQAEIPSSRSVPHPKQAKFHVVPYGVDVEFYSPHPNKAFRYRLLFVGGLKKRKGLEHLLKHVWPSIKALVPQAHLVIVGDGPERQRLMDLHAPGVEFLGRLSDQAKAVNYMLSDIFVFPSRLEGFGLAVAEAMACGLPIAHNGESTVMELVGDTDSQQHNIRLSQRLLSMLLHPDEAVSEGRAMRQRVLQYYTWDQCVGGTRAVYEGALASFGYGWQSPST